MSLRPTFLGFETMRKAINAAQKAMDITGNNISNVDTVGYSRQRLDLVSINTPGGGLRYQTSVSLSGQGVDSPGVTQLRDSFLDKRYRELNSDSAEAGTISGILSDIEGVLDVVGKDGFNVVFQNFKDALSKFSTDSPSRTEIANIVYQNAQQIVQTIRTYDTKLTAIQDQVKSEIESGVNRVTNIIQQIADLNSQITNSYVSSGNIFLEDGTYKVNELYGPNELKDERNNLLDELSNYGNISVTSNDNGSINVEFANINVVNDTRCSSLSLEEHSTGTLSLVFRDTGGRLTTVNTNDSDPANLLSSGALRGYLDMYNGAGVYADDPAILQKGMEASAEEANEILAEITEINASALSAADKSTALTDLSSRLSEYGNFTVIIDPADVNLGRVSLNIAGIDTEVISADGTTTLSEIDVSVDASNTLTYNLVYEDGTSTPAVFTSGDLMTKIDDTANANFTSDDGIVYYRKMIDALANTFARTYNEACSDMDFVDANGNYFIRAMFSPSDRGDEITAANIRISDEWTNDVSMITQKIEWANGVDNTDGIISVVEENEELWPGYIGKLSAVTTLELNFTIDNGLISTNDATIDQTCTIDNYIQFWSNKIGQDLEYQEEVYSAANLQAEDVLTQRDSIMGIDLNEEGINMMSYQKWFNAAAKMMTTLDEALDTIINNMGRVGA